jgi:ABC-type transport system substrate-binding protein
LYFSEFNTLNPVGTGPYKVTTIFQNTLPEKVVLQKFESYFDTEPFIEHLEFHIFPSKDQLFQSRDTLDGIQSISSQERSLFESSSRFQIFSYSLPQYVAAFLNTESPKLSHIKSRLGLALGIEKSKILQELSSVIPVSTPLLELDTSHWLLQYDTEKAQGGLSDAGFKLPSKQTITEEIKKENFITAPNNGENFATQETSLFLEGITPEGTQKVLVNNYELKLFSPEKKTFSYKMSTDIGTLKKGENTYKIEIEQNGQKKELQTFTLFLASSSEEQEREQQKYDAQKKEEETPNEPREIPNDSFRIDSQGNPFVLSLLTPENPPEFTKIAYFLKDEWAKIGVDSKIEILSPEQLQERVQNRDYDVLIFGQNLGYNLAYPYWHSSQANHGFNFSQLKNFEIDALLESIRSTHDEERRQKDLEKLETVLIEEMPAIFFYKPQHFFALSPKIKTLSPFTLQEEQDRISHIESWYINETFTLKQKRTLSSFLDWLLAELFL